jgi:plastocyanin
MKRLVLLLTIVLAVAAAPQALAATVQVSITRAAFVPDPVNIEVGDTVTWTNADTRDRQVVSQDAGFASPVLKPTDRFSFTFTRAGRFRYEDPLVSPRERGTVIVTAPSRSITIAASRTLVTFGFATKLTGKISSGQSGERVSIFAQRCGKGFSKIADVTTTSGGEWELTTKPLDHTSYRAEWRGANSSTLAIKVRPRIRLGKVAPRKYSVRVFAAQSFAGKAVAFQRWNATRGVWVRVRWVTLVDTGAGVDPTVISGRTFTSRIRARLLVRIAMGPVTAGECYLPNRSNAIRS